MRVWKQGVCLLGYELAVGAPFTTLSKLHSAIQIIILHYFRHRIALCQLGGLGTIQDVIQDVLCRRKGTIFQEGTQYTKSWPLTSVGTRFCRGIALCGWKWEVGDKVINYYFSLQECQENKTYSPKGCTQWMGRRELASGPLWAILGRGERGLPLWLEGVGLHKPNFRG